MEEREKTLGFLLGRASWAMSHLLKENFKKANIDLPHSQYAVLRELYAEDGLSQKAIANILHIDVAAVKRTLDNLEKRDLIVRQAVSLCKNSIQLTPKALAMKDAIISVADNTIEYILSQSEMSQDQYIEFRNFLQNIYNLTNR